MTGLQGMCLTSTHVNIAKTLETLQQHPPPKCQGLSPNQHLTIKNQPLTMENLHWAMEKRHWSM